jgi:asparagine synthase (glutamine-hydrolysing)
MCGFVTIVTAPGQSVSGPVLSRMTEVLAHRGPDDTGFAWVDPAGGSVRTAPRMTPDLRPSGVVFGHRRLSILDLSPAGHQPMVSEDGLSVLCFNGEIYNFVELREELRSRGAQFRGSGDTEVLLRAYEHWGAEALNRFNGMWAFVLWDGRRRKLIASRDRFGVKPLHYARVGETWILASEIKAILAYPGVFRGVEERVVLEFLSLGKVSPTEETMFLGVHSLPPATWLEIGDGQSSIRRFWALPSAGADPGQDQETVDRFTSLLSDSVRLRARSDVPIGTMMSGGLDSTAITALIREQQLLAAKGTDTFEGLRSFHQTFSACWPGSGQDEESEIDLMTSRLGLASHKVFPAPETIAAVLPTVMYHLEEPFPDPIAAVQYLLMKEARDNGVKVVLNGHGSDESLAGYVDHFVPPFLAGLLLSGRIPDFVREGRAFKSPEWDWQQVTEHVLINLLPSSFRSRAIGLARTLRLRSRVTLFRGPEPNARGASAELAGVPDPTPLKTAVWRKFSDEVLPVWLRMEDRMSMASSVESRLPFLDYRLVEFAFGLPDRFKLRDGYTKYILRRSMRGRLPDRLVEARVKLRFNAPYAGWFRGPWRPMISDLLLGECEVAPYLKGDRFRTRLRAYLDGSDSSLATRMLWRVLATELWLRMVRSHWAGSEPNPLASGPEAAVPARSI